MSSARGSIRSMSEPINKVPKPRVLLQDMSQEWIDVATSIFPTVKIIDSKEEIYEPDFDLLITTTPRFLSAEHISIIGVGIVPTAVPRIGTSLNHPYRYNLRQTTLAKEIEIYDENNEDLKDLIRRDLVPIYFEMSKKPYFTLSTDSVIYARQEKEFNWSMFKPFVIAGGLFALAGEFISVDDGINWYLPNEVSSIRAWLVAFWHRANQQGLPGFMTLPPTWQSDEWNTFEENNSKNNLVIAQEELVKVIDEKKSAIKNLLEIHEVNQEKAIIGWRRLLTSDGDDFANIVEKSFQLFGFETKNMDEVYPENDRHEDLQIIKNSELFGLVEAKGYLKGFQINDISRIDKHLIHYLTENPGKTKPKGILVVNHNRKLDPSLRPSVITAESDINTLIKEKNLIIDSRELFTAIKLLESGKIKPEILLNSIINTSGIWKCPSPK